MAAFSDYMEAKICNWMKGTAFGTAPTDIYVALFNGSPTDTGSGGTEVTATIRAAGRVAVTFGTVTDGAMSNDAAVDFGTAEGGATVSHFALFDAASSGNMLMYGALNGGSQAIAAGNQVSFPIGDIDVSVA